MRFDGDALLLVILLTTVLLVSVVVFPLVGYLGLGLCFGAVAFVLDVPLMIEGRRNHKHGGEEPGGGGTWGPGPPQGGGGGGGPGVREPRRPKGRPPAPARARR